MHHQPTPAELAALPEMATRERIYYFLTRAIECEEVWGLADGEGWVMGEEEGKTILRLWSYRNLAEACIDDAALHAESMALERFLDVLGNPPEVIHLEILPMPERPGALIEAQALLSMFESLIDSGTYFVEG